MRIVLLESQDRENGKITYSEILEEVNKSAKKGDFWILPEVFDTGWGVKSDTKFPSMENLIFFHQLSEKHEISVCGSFYVKKENGKFVNRFAVVTKDGGEYFTEKRHLFGDFETKYCKQGDKNLQFKIDGISFRVAVCYDLRFPVWCRQSEDTYDVLLCVSQWPLVRQFDKDLLLASRALENVAYSVNCNGLGGSDVFFADGKPLLNIPETERIAFFELDLAKLNSYRERKKYLSDADKFKIL